MRLTGRRRWCCPFATILLVVAALGTGLPSATEAHFPYPKYSYSSGGNCQGPTDPVSLVYYGSAATSVRTRKDIQRHLGWIPRGGGVQYIRDHSDCRGMYTDPGSAPNDKTRFHVRLWGIQHRDTEGRWETVGTPHHEDWVKFPQCGSYPGDGGHAVDKGAVDRKPSDRTPEGSGFDQGRRKIRQKVNTRRHDIKIRWFGNTRSFIQCDGDPAGSNGNLLWVSMGRH